VNYDSHAVATDYPFWPQRKERGKGGDKLLFTGRRGGTKACPKNRRWTTNLRKRKSVHPRPSRRQKQALAEQRLLAAQGERGGRCAAVQKEKNEHSRASSKSTCSPGGGGKAKNTKPKKTIKKSFLGTWERGGQKRTCLAEGKEIAASVKSLLPHPSISSKRGKKTAWFSAGKGENSSSNPPCKRGKEKGIDNFFYGQVKKGRRWEIFSFKRKKGKKAHVVRSKKRGHKKKNAHPHITAANFRKGEGGGEEKKKGCLNTPWHEKAKQT